MEHNSAKKYNSGAEAEMIVQFRIPFATPTSSLKWRGGEGGKGFEMHYIAVNKQTCLTWPDQQGQC